MQTHRRIGTATTIFLLGMLLTSIATGLAAPADPQGTQFATIALPPEARAASFDLAVSARDEPSMTKRVTSSGVAPMTADRAAVRSAVVLPDPPPPPMISPPPSSRSNVAGC